MVEPIAEQAPPAEQQQEPAGEQGTEGQSATDEALGDPGKAALVAERDARKAADKRAKELEKQLNEFRQASMSESEKAVAEAEQRGRTAAVTEYGTRLARAEFDAAAGRRNPAFSTADILELVDLSRFVTEDGEPDSKAIQKAVARLVPEADSGPPSFDGGVRTSPPQEKSFSDMLREQARR